MEAMDKCSSEPSEMLKGDVILGAELPPSPDGYCERAGRRKPSSSGGGVGPLSISLPQRESWTDAMDKCRGELQMQPSPSSGSVGDGGGLHSRSHLQRNFIIRESVLELNVVTVRRRISTGQTNAHQAIEGAEENIAEERAVCKFCFRKFKEEDGLKTKCGCTNAFAHEECEANWSRVKGNDNCDYCGKEVETSPVYFASRPVSTQGDIGTGSHQKKKRKIACFF